MERVFENAVKAMLIMKIFMWALVTLFGAFLLALPGLFGKSQNSALMNDLASDDPYASSDGNSADSLALRHL